MPPGVTFALEGKIIMDRFGILLICSFVLWIQGNVAFAGEKPAQLARVFVGNYQGVCTATSLSGELIAYNPIRLTLSKKGKISGAANVEEISTAGIPPYVTSLVGKVKGRTKVANPGFRVKVLQQSAGFSTLDGAVVSGKFSSVVGGVGSEADFIGSIRAGIDYIGQCVLQKF